jgi:hypothetical protein
METRGGGGVDILIGLGSCVLISIVFVPVKGVC